MEFSDGSTLSIISSPDNIMPNIYESPETAEYVGRVIADVLHLKVDANGLIETEYGPKSYRGLARMLKEVFKDNEIPWIGLV